MYYLLINFVSWKPYGKGKYRSMDNINIEKNDETLTEKMKKSRDERHT